MAKLQLGALAQSVSGSIAGNTFARNKGGAYVRTKASPTQPQTARQVEVRAIFTQVSQAWRNLTDAQRTAWINWADANPVIDVFGQSLKLNGIAAFQRMNAFLLTCGLTMLSDAPTAPTIARVAVTLPTANEAQANATVTLPATPGGPRYISLYAWPTASASITNVSAKLRYAGTQDATAGMIITFTPATVNPLLAIITGQTYHMLAVQHDEQGNVIGSDRFDITAT
jgi:hypothetical protein